MHGGVNVVVDGWVVVVVWVVVGVVDGGLVGCGGSCNGGVLGNRFRLVSIGTSNCNFN